MGAGMSFDEMSGNGGIVRECYGRLSQWLKSAPPELLASRRSQAELLFRRIGITFAVYGEKEATERLIPFDITPRIIARQEWSLLERGLVQRVRALNLFLTDVYGSREILRAGIVPADLVYRNPGYRPEMAGRRVPYDIYCHIAGIDIVRLDDRDFYVLEDNARTPSGVSYMLENREVMLRLFPELFSMHRVAPVENYPDDLLATLRSVAPRSASADPVAVVMTPGAVQLGLLRALVPGRQARRRAGRGLGPVRARRGGLHAHDAGAAADRRHLPPDRRRVPRPAGLPARFGAGRARPLRRLPGRQRHARQRGRHRGRGRQGDLHLHPRRHPLLPSARSPS